jgi:hypothetical protein
LPSVELFRYLRLRLRKTAAQERKCRGLRPCRYSHCALPVALQWPIYFLPAPQ